MTEIYNKQLYNELVEISMSINQDRITRQDAIKYIKLIETKVQKELREYTIDINNESKAFLGSKGLKAFEDYEQTRDNAIDSFEITSFIKYIASKIKSLQIGSNAKYLKYTVKDAKYIEALYESEAGEFVDAINIRGSKHINQVEELNTFLDTHNSAIKQENEDYIEELLQQSATDTLELTMSLPIQMLIALEIDSILSSDIQAHIIRKYTMQFKPSSSIWLNTIGLRSLDLMILSFNPIVFQNILELNTEFMLDSIRNKTWPIIGSDITSLFQYLLKVLNKYNLDYKTYNKLKLLNIQKYENVGPVLASRLTIIKQSIQYILDNIQ